MSKKGLVSPPIQSALAENLADQVLPRQNGSRRQGIFRVFRLLRVKAAPRAGIAPKIFHAAETFG